jgi:hypothetical protein
MPAIEKWFVAHYSIRIEFKHRYWRWTVTDIYSKREYAGKDKDKAVALADALTELAQRSIRDGITQPHYDQDPINWA